MCEAALVGKPGLERNGRHGTLGVSELVGGPGESQFPHVGTHRVPEVGAKHAGEVSGMHACGRGDGVGAERFAKPLMEHVTRTIQPGWPSPWRRP